MTPADFSTFYEAVHGYPPFPWQERLLQRVVNEGWPPVISLPTSSGKTSAIDVAVFHLALESGKSALARKASLRIFFVIDRRVVVDEAAEHASKLAKALLDPEEEVVISVAHALKNFGANLPLDVAVLRGGMYRDNTWADEPNQPLVCVSTVDQIGSRLLFRGYQVSDEAKPVHAGLVGNDALIIVDEAHLSTPFLDTLGSVKQNSASQVQISRSIQLVNMSATIDSGTFSLEEADHKNPVLCKRLEASKPAELRAPEKGFETELVRAAKQLAGQPGVFVTGVVVNTVAVARAVFEDLRKSKDSEAILLTGRNRPYCSKQLWEKYKPQIAAKPNRVSDKPLFVVATQTVEVGVNLDFDALVTESAPLDALRQRFGRLNRLGNRPEAQAIIVRWPKEDPVYKEATVKTWGLLLSLPKVDFGISAMDEALKGQDPACFNTHPDQGPIVFPKYFEMWAQTNPPPEPDPDVAPFLHGPDALEDADIQVVWREDLIENGAPQNWWDAVELAPPVSSESLALPLGTLRRWLGNETKLNVTDLEGQPAEKENTRKEARPVLIWRGTKNRKPLTKASEIRPGDVVVLPAAYGGCDEFGWHPESRNPVEDIGDLANNEMAKHGLRKYRVRLDLFANSLAREKEKQAEVRKLIRMIQDPSADEQDSDVPNGMISFLPDLVPGKRPRIDSTGHIAIWPKQKPQHLNKPQIQSDLKPEDLDDDSVGLECKITIKRHTAGVVEHTRRYASSCGLDSNLVEDLVLAAELHDLGKWDERFQAWLFEGSLPRALRALKAGEPLAKSDGSLTLAERKKAQEAAHYPQGARHESASVLLARASGELCKAKDQDLVLHLIGTHHGYGRPLLPFWDEDESETVIAEFNSKILETGTGRHLARFDSGWIDRFSELNQKYGYWGLAYLEAILRRADCMQSRKEQEAL